MDSGLYVSINFVRALVATLARHGIAAEELFRRSTVSAAQLTDSRAQVPLVEWRALVRRALLLSGDRGLGLDIGSGSSDYMPQLVTHLALSCGTLREALHMLLRYSALLANTLNFSLVEEGSLAQFVCTPLSPDPEAPQFEPEMVLTLAYRAGRRFAISESHGAAEVWFEHATPPYAARCEENFRCPVRFDRSRNAILLSRRCLDHPQPYADGALVEVLREHAERALAQLGSPNVPDRVRALLSGADLRQIDARQIAQILKLHPRALRSQLGQAQTSWSQLLDETRRGIACDELRRGDVQVRHLAERLGFTDPSAFSRAFKRWTGETPARYARANGGR